MNMEANIDSVYQEISVISNWRNWHPSLKDLSENEFSIQDDGSMKVRNDLLKITQSKKEEVIAEFKKAEGRPLISGMKLITYPHVDSLTVQWYMDFNLRWYPWEKFRSLFYDYIYGSQMEQGLSNLKQLMLDRRSSLR